MATPTRVAWVTGGTSGVGRSVTKALVADGAFVHFVGTDRERGAELERMLNSDAPTPRCRFVRLDLSVLRNVHECATRFAAAAPRLDVLANIAGVLLPTRCETVDGHEMTLTIGHLAPFVLCEAMRPVLARTRDARIVNVSGRPSLLSKPRLDFEDLQMERRYTQVRAALAAVHAKTVMTGILAERYAADGIDVNAFHPGGVRSQLARHMRFPLRHLVGFVQRFMAAESETGAWVATSPDVTGITGKLFVGHEARPLVFGREYESRLLEATTALVRDALAATPG